MLHPHSRVPASFGKQLARYLPPPQVHVSSQHTPASHRICPDPLQFQLGHSGPRHPAENKPRVMAATMLRVMPAWYRRRSGGACAKLQLVDSLSRCSCSGVVDRTSPGSPERMRGVHRARMPRCATTGVPATCSRNRPPRPSSWEDGAVVDHLPGLTVDTFQQLPARTNASALTDSVKRGRHLGGQQLHGLPLCSVRAPTTLRS